MALDHPEDALAPATRLGGYEILRVLGRGGFGVTYAARERGRLGRMVAIKELFPVGLCVRKAGGSVFPAPEADERILDEAVAMFRRESELICTLRHPHLVRGVEWIEANRTGYLVMDYVSGKSLREHLAPRSRGGSYAVNPETVAQLCRGVLDALDCLHREGIVHCDIKPDNVFLGVGFEPILIDLGSACVPRTLEADSMRTYSLHYSAIEQVDESYGRIGPWTDLYQFGAVLYRCLSDGKIPDAQERAAAAEDPYLPPYEIKDLAAAYPADFLAAVDAVLALAPADRPGSLAEWRAMLDPPLRRMAPLPPPLPPPARRRGGRPPSWDRRDDEEGTVILYSAAFSGEETVLPRPGGQERSRPADFAAPHRPREREAGEAREEAPPLSPGPASETPRIFPEVPFVPKPRPVAGGGPDLLAILGVALLVLIVFLVLGALGWIGG